MDGIRARQTRSGDSSARRDASSTQRSVSVASDGGIARALDVRIIAAVLLKDQAAEELASASAAVKALHARLASEAEGREMEGLGKRLELAKQCKSSAQADFERRVAT